jgi:hypothetical protein
MIKTILLAPFCLLFFGALAHETAHAKRHCTVVDGSCGSSNGVAVSSAPTINLCSAGTASAVTGSGPWNWSCAGRCGGTTASCLAPVVSSAVNGSCGTANGKAASTAPSTGLCTTGAASALTGSGPWNWSCAGSNGGTTASCSAPYSPAPTNGQCGPANGVTVSTAPTTGLCSGGLASSVTGTGPWNWSCAGSNSGTTASCQAPTKQGSGLIPANRVTTWVPGVTYNGGIPNRTTIYKTLSPSGGDDTAAIQAALNSCPAQQVVQLTAGVFKITGNGLSFVSPNCTLRGAGAGKGLSTGINPVAPAQNNTGTFTVDPTATQLIKADRATNLNYAILYVGNDPTQFSTSINLAADAVQGTNTLTLASNPGINVGEIVLIDQNTDNDPDVVWGPSFGPAGDGSRRWFMRQDRSLNQMMEVTAVNGNTITFATPFHITFQTAYQAQLSRYANPVMHGIGIENIFFFGGMGGDWHGNVSMNLCAYCWIKNVEAFWSVGTSVGLYGTYRSELRDSFIHETPDPNPGGAGYLVGLNYGASDNLVENNIMWYGNKVDVMRATGGGNVLAYNYMDDSFGSTYPESPEAGVNAGHYTTPHMELLEGNYSSNFKGDTYWGNSIYITVFRNWLSALRAAHPPLNTYDYISGNCNYLYGDYTGRIAVDVQAYSYNQNFVGNVLGMQNQQLLSNPYQSQSCYNGVEGGFTEQVLTSADNNTASNIDAVIMWNFGDYQASVNTSCQCWSWIDTTIDTQLRNGNFDWVTKAQHWYGIGGTTDGAVAPMTIPNSLYLTSKPAFFGPNPWPWVDPSTGTTYDLPAKYCFEHNMMPTCLLNTTLAVQ